MKRIALTGALAAALPAHAASGPFLSLGNTNFIVTISFLIFIAVIIHFKAPQFAGKLLDGRIDAIRSQIEKAADLRSEAESALQQAKAENAASAKQAETIIAHANENSQRLIAEAESRIEEATARRIHAAQEQIISAEQAALDGIRNEAIDIAVDTAAAEVAAVMTASDRNAMTKRALDEIRANIS